MRKIYIPVLILCASLTRGQVVLDYPHIPAQTYNIAAPEYVRLMPGFEYNPQAGNYFRAHIDAGTPPIAPIMYVEEPVDPETRQLDYNQVVGTTPGEASVSLTGGAIYKIPVYCPPGTGGMEPGISLNYNHQSMGRIAGIGWDLNGILAIERVKNTIYHDGAVKGVNFSRDHYALNSQRLIKISVNGNDTTYYTETFNGSKIISHGGYGGGPLWFEIITKEGQVIELGKTENSRLLNQFDTKSIITWYVNKITDLNGNYIDFLYGHNSVTEMYIKEINYTGNDKINLEPYNSIRFFYGERKDVSKYYLAGTALNQTLLLDHIDIVCESKIIKSYKLNYYFDRFSKLNEIIEYGSDNASYNSTVFGYDKTNLTTSVLNTGITAANNGRQVLYADFNRDGLTDIYRNTGQTETYEIYLNRGGRFSTNPDWSDNFDHRVIQTVSGDYNGDGLTDLIYMQEHDVWYMDREWEVFLLLNNGNGFSRHFLHGGTKKDKAIYTLYSLDIDGDQIDELMEHHDYKGDEGDDKIYFYRIEPSNTAVYIPELYIQPGAEAEHINIIEINGDGALDLLITFENTSWIYTFGRTGNQYFQRRIYDGGFPTKYHRIYPGDFNGDGLTDLLTRVIDPQTGQYNWYLDLWIGTHYIGRQLEDIHFFDGEDGVSVNDYNSDNICDITVSRKDLINPTQYGLFCSYYYFDGINFTIDEPVQVAQGNIYGAITGNQINNRSIDFNGDGFNDCSIVVGGTEPIHSILMKTQKNHYVHQVADGLNQKYIFKYNTTANPDVYTVSDFKSYPVRTMVQPIRVVQRMSGSNGIGGYFTTSYSYSNAVLNLIGKGFIGFSLLTASSDISPIINEQRFNIDNEHFFMKPAGTRSFINTPDDTEILSSSFSVFDKKTGYEVTNKVFYPYEAVSERYDYSLENRVLIEYNYDIYGNNTYSKTSYYPSIASAPPLSYTIRESLNFVPAGSWCNSKPMDVRVKQYRQNTPEIITSTHFIYHFNGAIRSQYNYYGLPKQVLIEYPELSPVGLPVKTVVSSNGLSSKSSSIAFDEKYRFITASVNTLGDEEHFSYEPVFGNLISSLDANGLMTNYFYDGFGNLKKTVNPDGTIQEISLKWNTTSGLGNALYFAKSTSNIAPDISIWYDCLSREVLNETVDFNNKKVKVTNTFNEKMQLIRVSEPSYDVPVFFTSYYYNKYGQTERIVYPSGDFDILKYPEPGNPGTSFSVYNNATKITTTKKFDATGEVTEYTDPGGTIQYTYYSDGNQKEIIHPDGSKTLMEYDVYGRQTVLNDPDAGITRYVYNAYGELEKQTDANLNEFVLSYDKLGRLVTKQGSEFTLTNTYDDCPHCHGKLSSSSMSNGTKISYEYDKLSRVVKKTVERDKQYEFRYDYDERGFISKYTFPTGFTIDHAYNDNGFLAKVSNAQRGTIYVPVSTNERGQLTFWTNGEYNQIKNEVLYSPLGYETARRCTALSSGHNIQNLETGFDSNTGNLLFRRDKNKTVDSQFLTENFEYDPVHKNRLISWKVTGQPKYAIDFDNINGNIRTKTDVTASTDAYVYNSLKPHAVAEIINPVHSELGIQQHVTYNEFNKVSEIVHNTQGYRLTIQYGPDEQRIQSNLYVNGNLSKTMMFVTGDYEIELLSNGAERHIHYLPGGAMYILNESGSGQMNYIQTDYLGNWCSVITYTGSIIEKYNFDPWGRRRNPNDWSYNNVSFSFIFDRGFTGHEHLDEFGLINMNGRMYDPLMARFLSPDKYIANLKNTQAYNRYSYCFNNPLKYVDPSGDTPFFILAANIAMQGIIRGDMAHRQGHSFMSGFIAGASTSILSIPISNSIMGAAVALAAPTALSSMIYETPFNFKAMAVDAALMVLVGYLEYTGVKSDVSLFSTTNNPINTSLPRGYGMSAELGDPPIELPVVEIRSTRISKWPRVFDNIQTGLDVIGLIPGYGELFDALNATIYISRGDFVNAGLSMAAIVPFAGWAATGGKLTNKAYKATKTLGKNFNKISDNLLKRSGIDAHQLKRDFLGNKVKISQYDLYKDTKTGEILILQKGGKGTAIQTGEFIK